MQTGTMMVGLLPAEVSPGWAGTALRTEGESFPASPRRAWRRALARKLTAQMLNVDEGAISFGRTALGRPRLIVPGHPEADVSFSESNGRSAVAVSGRGPVGIDLEQRCPAESDLLPMARLIMPQGDVVILAGLAEPQRTQLFLAAWTRREAILKLLGTGLTDDPRQLDLEEDIQGGGSWTMPGSGHVGRWRDLDAGMGWACAVAGLAPERPPSSNSEGCRLRAT